MRLFHQYAENILTVVGVCLAASACGCSGDGDKVAVHGNVTVNGQPLSDGLIRFINLAEGGSMASTSIANGEYSIPAQFGVKPGDHTVQIEGYRTRKSSIPPPAYLSAEQVAKGASEQYLPARFNRQSELKVEVTAEGENTHDFKLKLDR